MIKRTKLSLLGYVLVFDVFYQYVLVVSVTVNFACLHTRWYENVRLQTLMKCQPNCIIFSIIFLIIVDRWSFDFNSYIIWKLYKYKFKPLGVLDRQLFGWNSTLMRVSLEIIVVDSFQTAPKLLLIYFLKVFCLEMKPSFQNSQLIFWSNNTIMT